MDFLQFLAGLSQGTLAGRAMQPAVAAPVQQNNGNFDALSQLLQKIYEPKDPLGTVARSNTRPGGLTGATDWTSMFAPIDPARQLQMTSHPLATQQQLAGAPGMFNPATAAANASTSWQPSYQTPQLGPVLPGTMQEAQLQGKLAPRHTPSFFDLFRL